MREPGKWHSRLDVLAFGLFLALFAAATVGRAGWRWLQVRAEVRRLEAEQKAEEERRWQEIVRGIRERCGQIEELNREIERRELQRRKQEIERDGDFIWPVLPPRYLTRETQPQRASTCDGEPSDSISLL
jgi:hypothetical protein